MVWRVKCSKNDTPGTLYDKKWKADKVARDHKRRNPDHNVKVQMVQTEITVKEEYVI